MYEIDVMLLKKVMDEIYTDKTIDDKKKLLVARLIGTTERLMAKSYQKDPEEVLKDVEGPDNV